tara:strand:- start:620 stop:1102 length:483 start_codon:yes stop_codon:yes gene_type:complete
MRVYTQNIGHGQHEIEVYGETKGEEAFRSDDVLLARCTTTNTQAIEEMDKNALRGGGHIMTPKYIEAKEALIDEAFEKGCVKTAMEEFNRTVKGEKKAMLKGSAEGVLHALKNQHDYRHFGINGMSFDELITEIVQAEVLGICFVDDIDLTEAVLDWCGI